MKIPFSPPDIGEAEIAEVVDTLRSGWITTGPKTKTFEKELAAYCHTDTVACLNSATACAELALRVLGIGPGDEVIVPAYTYTASASVVDHVGATIVMVDTAQDSFEMDYDRGEVRYRTALMTEGACPVDGVLDRYIQMPAAMLDRYAAGMEGIIHEGQIAQEALAMVED